MTTTTFKPTAIFARDLLLGHVITDGDSEDTVSHVAHHGEVVIVKTATGGQTEYAADAVLDVLIATASSVPEFAVERGEGFNYMLGTGDPWRGGITATSAPRPERFTWGRVLKTHVVGEDYAIVEYAPRKPGNRTVDEFDPSPQFSVFVTGARGSASDTGHSYHSLDEALIAAIAWKHEQARDGINAAANSRAVKYVCKMLGIEGW